LVLQARTARMVWTAVAMVSLDATESPVTQEKMAPTAAMDVMAMMVLADIRVTKVTPVIKVLPEFKVFEVLKATRAIPVPKVLVALRACRALAARQVQTDATVWQ
jgi:hypothetical protein